MKKKNKVEQEDELYKEKNKKLSVISSNKKLMILLFIIMIFVIILLISIFSNKEGNIKTKFKSSLDRIVEKSDLETVNFTYNVVAKKCKDENDCNKKSNNIDDFKYVVSCKGTITAGIDFEKVDVVVDEKNKKLIIKIPDAVVLETNVGSLKFLNGDDISADELPNVRNLCEETIQEKCKNDGKLLPAAKEQAEVVFQSFYEQWVKSFNKKYKLEIK